MEGYKRVEQEDGNGNVRIVFQTQGKLISMGTSVLTNVNQKNYRVFTVEVPSKNGLRQVGAACYEANYNHPDIESGDVEPMEEGTSYLTTLTFGEDGQPYFQISHLTGAGLASKEDFSAEDFGIEVAAEAEVPSGAPQRA